MQLETSATTLSTEHDAIEDVVGRGPSAVRHHQDLWLVETRLTATLGLAEHLSLSFLLPYRVLDTRIHYLEAGSPAEVPLVTPSIHHRNETLAGLADPWLMARVAYPLGKWRVGATLGFTFPVGSTVEDPFKLGDAGQPHEHIQFGTGTLDPVARIEATRVFERLSIGAWVFTQQVWNANPHGYRAGSRYAGGIVASSSLGTQRFRVQAGAEAQGETPEEWNGLVRTDEGNQGRVDVLAMLAGTVRLGEHLRATASVRVPLYTYVVGGQLSYPLVATLGLGGTFDISGDPPRPHVHAHGDSDHDDDDELHADAHDNEHAHSDGHEHAHADAQATDYTCGMHPEVSSPRPGPCPVCGMDLVPRSSLAAADWSGLDEQVMAPPGAAVELVPIAGKVTVYDLFATWCVPCRDLDRRLAAIARRSDGRLAVRKVDIVDWSSAAAERYLAPGSFNLPHLVVFGSDGKKRFARSGTPKELARAVEEVLAK